MTTWMPFIKFTNVALTLHIEDLYSQCERVWHILEHLRSGEASGPAEEMWRGNEQALVVYGRIMCDFFRNRTGNSMYALRYIERFDVSGTLVEWPEWTGDVAMMTTHRSNLIRRRPEYYGPMFPNTPFDLAFLWPRILGNGEYELYVTEEDRRKILRGVREDPFVVLSKGKTVAKIKLSEDQLKGLVEITGKSKHAEAAGIKEIAEAKLEELSGSGE